MESTRVPDLSEIAVCLGLDVGKGEHHAVALTPNGKTLHDKALPNSEPRLRALFAKLARHGRVLVVVDQPASIGALPVTVARDAGCLVAYLLGLTMRRIADLYPGEAKTDARDARIIADAARTMPHTLRDLQPDDETIAALHMLLGFDDDLAAEATRTSNRIRGLLTAIHPHLERVLGPRIHHPAVLALLEHYGTRPRSTPPGSRNSSPCCAPAHPGWPAAWPPTSSPPSTNRPSRSRAPTPPRSSCPASPHPCAPSWTSANASTARSRPSWKPTLFPRS
jgi:hypothetical protein